jgi:hypothetical protein
MAILICINRFKTRRQALEKRRMVKNMYKRFLKPNITNKMICMLGEMGGGVAG